MWIKQWCVSCFINTSRETLCLLLNVMTETAVTVTLQLHKHTNINDNENLNWVSLFKTQWISAEQWKMSLIEEQQTQKQDLNFEAIMTKWKNKTLEKQSYHKKKNILNEQKYKMYLIQNLQVWCLQAGRSTAPEPRLHSLDHLCVSIWTS